MENYYPEVPKNWFQRNWKWLVPTGCFTLIVIVGLFCVGLYFGITSIMKNSDVYTHSISVLQKNKTVLETIGNNIDSDGAISGSITTSNYSGNAVLDIPVKGSKGEGLLHVEAEMHNNVWVYNILNFFPKGSANPIDLNEEMPLE